MSRAAVHLFAFAVYLFVLGTVLLFDPNFLFGVVDLACAAWTFLALRADAAAAPVRA
jgi:hypothetical protein